ncbi:MAG: helix-turn-helix domain-containing protein [Candidatus Peribacteria bacterium]|nr:helix-turn-helix domain-containing protein [Candidatus Peribacteria bacterium]
MKKQKIIEKYLDKILRIEECTAYFQCPERTFYRWLKKYREK